MFTPCCGPVGLTHHHPMGRALHELVDHGCVEAMAGLVRNDVPDDQHADKQKIQDISPCMPLLRKNLLISRPVYH